MVGAWSGLDNRPVRPASRRRPGAICVAGVAIVVAAGQSGPAPLPSPATEGMRRGSPTQRQGRNRVSEVLADRPGGRPVVRVAQDRVPLGQGGQATLPEDARGQRRYLQARIRELATSSARSQWPERSGFPPTRASSRAPRPHGGTRTCHAPTPRWRRPGPVSCWHERFGSNSHRAARPLGGAACRVARLGRAPPPGRPKRGCHLG
jgi:hypothetical protein